MANAQSAATYAAPFTRDRRIPRQLNGGPDGYLAARARIGGGSWVLWNGGCAAARARRRPHDASLQDRGAGGRAGRARRERALPPGRRAPARAQAADARQPA